jgi:glycosyltransferase involved in cell wall biosynthesis
MTIAFVSFIKDPWGGSEVLWAEAAHLALAEGHRVVISALKVARPSEPLRRLQAAGATVHLRRGFINPAWGRNRRILNKARILLLNLLSNPYRHIATERPDIVVFTGACYAMLLNKSLYRLVRKAGIPLVLNNQVNIEYTRPIDREQAAFLREVYGYVSLAAFVSRRNLTVAERHLVQRIPRAAVVRNPVNLRSLEPLLEVLSDERWKARPLRLHIYGSGSDEAHIRDLIAFYGLSERVVMEGSASDIRSVWSLNHILVMPSLNEGMPLSVVEAMLCGRPVVTTDVGGNTEWITDGVEGFIADGANTRAVDAALEAAWQRRDEWSAIGLKAHGRALALHDPNAGETLLRLILEHGRRT